MIPSQQRGQAIAELVIVLPVLLFLLLSLPFSVQLINCRLRLLEAARWGGWERTVYGREGGRELKPTRDPSQRDSSIETIMNSLFYAGATFFAKYPDGLFSGEFIEEDFALPAIHEIPFGRWDELPVWEGSPSVDEDILRSVQELGLSASGTATFRAEGNPLEMEYLLPWPFANLTNHLDPPPKFKAQTTLVPDPWKSLSLSQIQQVLADTWYQGAEEEKEFLSILDEITIDHPEINIDALP